MRTLRALLCLAGLAALNAAAAEPAPAATRFSQAVATQDRTALGLVRLDSDQLAVLDVMVRRDTAARASLHADPEAPANFSQRLTPDERRLAGLNVLTVEEVARLDAAVARFTSGAVTRSLLAPPTYLSRASKVEPKEAKQEREIHGSFSLSYGWGKGGYSEKTGSMMLTLDDPAHRYSITIGYTESHIKGPDGIRYIEGPPYRP